MSFDAGKGQMAKGFTELLYWQGGLRRKAVAWIKLSSKSWLTLRVTLAES